jgi:hypothetical protein
VFEYLLKGRMGFSLVVALILLFIEQDVSIFVLTWRDRGWNRIDIHREFRISQWIDWVFEVHSIYT